MTRNKGVDFVDSEKIFMDGERSSWGGEMINMATCVGHSHLRNIIAMRHIHTTQKSCMFTRILCFSSCWTSPLTYTWHTLIPVDPHEPSTTETVLSFTLARMHFSFSCLHFSNNSSNPQVAHTDPWFLLALSSVYSCIIRKSCQWYIYQTLL